ncbi:MAG: TlpA family protein disulfide reductase [Proteobacteria bacterium]|nr:TlpA family protein disulfide reductase [Pseudomonadota bacterium]
MQGAGKKYKDSGLQVIGLGIQDKKENIKAFAGEKRLEWPVGFDEGDEIAKRYGVTFGAGLIFIDREGVVRGRFLGGFGQEELELEIAKIL